MHGEGLAHEYYSNINIVILVLISNNFCFNKVNDAYDYNFQSTITFFPFSKQNS